MNGHYFMQELKTQVEAVKAMGNCRSNWSSTYSMYNESEKRLGDFIKHNRINLVVCLDVIFNNTWISTDDRADAFISLYESGDYDDALGMLSYGTIWKFRNELEHITFDVERV